MRYSVSSPGYQHEAGEGKRGEGEEAECPRSTDPGDARSKSASCGPGVFPAFHGGGGEFAGNRFSEI